MSGAAQSSGQGRRGGGHQRGRKGVPPTPSLSIQNVEQCPHNLTNPQINLILYSELYCEQFPGEREEEEEAHEEVSQLGLWWRRGKGQEGHQEGRGQEGQETGQEDEEDAVSECQISLGILSSCLGLRSPTWRWTSRGTRALRRSRRRRRRRRRRLSHSWPLAFFY